MGPFLPARHNSSWDRPHYGDRCHATNAESMCLRLAARKPQTPPLPPLSERDDVGIPGYRSERIEAFDLDPFFTHRNIQSPDGPIRA